MGDSLELINLEGLVKRLNSAIDESEGNIELKESFKKAEKGWYDLIQNIDFTDNLFDAFFCPKSETPIGTIYFERGDSEDNSAYGGIYERVKLAINQPLKLKKGNILPSCKIRLLVEGEDCGKTGEFRQDYINRFGLFWKRADLSKILPTKWFLY